MIMEYYKQSFNTLVSGNLSNLLDVLLNTNTKLDDKYISF